MKPSHKAAAICLLALSATSLAQAQVQGSALDYLLQRPRVTKTYPQKHAFDHLFTDIGGGINLMGQHSPEVGGQAAFNVGDWITPEHGLRLHAAGGRWHVGGIQPKFATLGIDYLLNITALSQPGSTYTARPFEVYGIAGAGYTVSHYVDNTQHGLDLHLGLRTQVALSPFTYLYAEPLFTMMEDDVTHAPNRHGYRPAGSITAGLGYRLGQRRHVAAPDSAEHRRWTDGAFIGVGGGPLFFVSGDPSAWKHNTGGRATASIGKWFGPLHGARITASATTMRQQGASRLNAVGLQADYLLNLHNAFGGVNPDRRFWVNGVAGLGWNVSSNGNGTHNRAFGMGGGLQANVRLTRDIDFSLEPRVDAYRTAWSPDLTTASSWDLTAALLAGLTYTYHDRSGAQRANDPFEQNTWHDHTFVELAAGGNVPVNRSGLRHPADYVRPQVYAAVGKWFTPVHGARIWAQLSQTQWGTDADRSKHADAGIDYVLNVTNAFYGYRAFRPFELTGAVGVNLSRRQGHSTPYLGGDASLRGTWNVSPLLGIFVEPRLMAYGHRYMPFASGQQKADFLLAAQAGVQFNMQGFDRAEAYGRMNEDGQELRRSITVAGGLAAPANHFRSSDYRCPVGRVAYTQWYTPLSAWRVGLQAMARGAADGERWAQASADIDWMTDLTAQTYGYDVQRPLAVRAFAGANVGADSGGGHTYFAPDVHVGGQLSVRLTDDWHIVAEPQVACRLTKRFKDERLGRWMPQLLLGLDYSLGHQASASADLKQRPARPHFVQVGIGTGGFSANYREMSPFGRKLTLTTDVAYGQWANSVSGVHAGVSNTVAQRHGKGNECITALHAGYMMNLAAAMQGTPTDEHGFQLTGIIGASLNISSRTGRSAQLAPGLMAALQAGWRVTPSVELYLEPAATVTTDHIEPGGTSHPFDGELKLSIGTKYCF